MTIHNYVDSYLDLIGSAQCRAIEDENLKSKINDVVGICISFKDITIARIVFYILFVSHNQLIHLSNKFPSFTQSDDGKVNVLVDKACLGKQISAECMQKMKQKIKQFMINFAIIKWKEFSSENKPCLFAYDKPNFFTYESCLIKNILSVNKLANAEGLLSKVSISEPSLWNDKNELSISGKIDDINKIFNILREELSFRPRSLKELAARSISSNPQLHDIQSLSQDVKDEISKIFIEH